jgi:hypothetical protein
MKMILWGRGVNLVGDKLVIWELNFSVKKIPDRIARPTPIVPRNLHKFG